MFDRKTSSMKKQSYKYAYFSSRSLQIQYRKTMLIWLFFTKYIFPNRCEPFFRGWYEVQSRFTKVCPRTATVNKTCSGRTTRYKNRPNRNRYRSSTFSNKPCKRENSMETIFLNPLSYYNNRVSRIRSAHFSDQKTGGKLVKTKLQKNGECHQCPDEKYVSKTQTGGGGTWGTNGNTTDSVGSFNTVVPNRWSADHRWSVT